MIALPVCWPRHCSVKQLTWCMGDCTRSHHSRWGSVDPCELPGLRGPLFVQLALWQTDGVVREPCSVGRKRWPPEEKWAHQVQKYPYDVG